MWCGGRVLSKNWKKAGLPTEGADILLGLLENTLDEYHKALALIEASQL